MQPNVSRLTVLVAICPASYANFIRKHDAS
jgi:hypothetical protein